MGNIYFLNIHLIVILAPQNKKSQSILAQDGKHPGKALEFQKGPGKGPDKIFSPRALEKYIERW